MPVVAFLVASVYWGGTAAFAVAPRWAVLCLVPLMLFGRRVEMKAAHWAGLALLLYAAGSILWAPVRYDAFDGMMKLLLLAGCFMLGSLTEDMTSTYRAFAAGVALSAAFACFQYWGWGGLYQLVSPAGTFGNKNFLGEAAALAFLGVAGTRYWPLAAMALVGLALSGCREAWLATGAGLAVVLWLKTNRLRLVIECGLMAAGALVLVSLDHLPDFGTRIAIWKDTFLGLTWSGRGIGSFMVALPEYGRYLGISERPEFAHNDILQLLFELGPVGFMAFGVLGCCLCFTRGVRERAILVAVGAESLLGFPLHMPATGFLAACVAGHAARSCPDLRIMLVGVRTLCSRRLGVARRAVHQVERA